jgi:formylglycine-generating enzyme required for sulfatase activity
MTRVGSTLGVVCVAMGLVLTLLMDTEAACPPDSVQAGPACIDKYEASAWHVPSTEKALIAKIRNGTVTLADLTSAKAVAAGVVQVGLTPPVDPDDDWTAAGCPVHGTGCLDVYAVSIAGVTPATNVPWPRAAAIARNSGKRLPTNQEWQVAALGTPENASCNIQTHDAGQTAPTGSHPGCVSDVGAFDMVGNVAEWVAEWVPRHTCSNDSISGAGINCFVGDADPSSGPTALIRGLNGVFAVEAQRTTLLAGELIIGFRAAR